MGASYHDCEETPDGSAGKPLPPSVTAAFDARGSQQTIEGRSDFVAEAVNETRLYPYRTLVLRHRPSRTRAGAAIIAACLTIPVGCAHKRVAPPPPVPELTSVTPQTKCGVRRSADKPLVVEWPAADRAALEARARTGLVAVRYEGCEMELLPACNVGGEYEFMALERKQERVTIHNEDELYARLPVGAASLEGKLARSGELAVDMTIVGRKQALRHVFERSELEGQCGTATHVLTGLTVGAFSLLAGASTEAGASVGVGGAGAGGGVTRAREVLASDGDPSRCDVEPFDGEPAPGCGAVLRVEAVPLAGAAPVTATPTAIPPEAAVDEGPDREERERIRRRRRAGAWRGVGIGSAVLSGASLGTMVGGAVLLMQYQDDTFGIDVQETEADRAKRAKGTALVTAGITGFLGFGALSIGAIAASKRARGLSGLSASVSPRFTGVALSGRF